MLVDLTYEEICWLANSIEIKPNRSAFPLCPAHIKLSEKMRAIEKAAAVKYGEKFIKDSAS